jgi:hypothetical protein
MDGTQRNRRYEAGDTIKLEIVLHHRANLKEVRAIFTHTQDKSAPPLMARGQPRAISERDADGSIRSRLKAEIKLPPQIQITNKVVGFGLQSRQKANSSERAGS